jgi:hypothetical protein
MSERSPANSSVHSEEEIASLKTIKWGACVPSLNDLTQEQRSAVIYFDHELQDVNSFEIIVGSDPTRRPKYIRQCAKYLRDAKLFLVKHWPDISIESASNHPIMACEPNSFYLQSHFSPARLRCNYTDCEVLPVKACSVKFFCQEHADHHLSTELKKSRRPSPVRLCPGVDGQPDHFTQSLKKAMDVRSAVGSKAIAARWEAKKLPTSTSSISSVGDGSNNQSSSFLAPGSVPAPAPAPSSPPSNLAPSDSHAPSLSYTFESTSHQIVPTSFSPAPPPPPTPPPTQWFSGVTFSVDPDGSATTNQKRFHYTSAV